MAFFALTRVVASPWQIQPSQLCLVTKVQTRCWASIQVWTFISIRRSSNALVIMHPKIPRLVTRRSGSVKMGKR